MLYWLTLLAAGLWSVTAAFGEADVDSILARPVVTGLKISPDGKYLAARVFVGDRHVLRVLDVKNFNVVGGLDPRARGGSAEVGSYHWASNRRLVGQLLQSPAGHAAPVDYGELFGVDYDGRKATMLFGFRSGQQQTGTHIRRKDSDWAWAEVIDPLPEISRKILISVKSYSVEQDRLPVAKLLDIKSGIEGNVLVQARSPFASFHTDSEGELRMIINQTREDHREIQVRPVGAEQWSILPTTSHGTSFTPVSVPDTNGRLYALDHFDSDTRGLYRFELESGKLDRVYTHDALDLTDALQTVDMSAIYGVMLDDGYPSYLLMKKSLGEAQTFSQLLETFSGRIVDIVSATRDGTKWIVSVESDVDPGTYYLFDSASNKARRLLAAKPDLDVESMRPVKPVSFASRDGLQVHGYFTAAAGAGDKSPLLVLVHGGPRSRDYWRFDPMVQAFATSGVSVLQINFRGSTGYGLDFLHAGDREWGRKVQYDIIDGTRWAIAEGLVKEGAICIGGTSFGGYAAMQSVVLEPDLYSCAIANAGVYDLDLLYRAGDVRYLYGGRDYLEEAIGKDSQELSDYSPVDHLAGVATPVLVAHGRSDKRSPFKHARRLISALEEHGVPHETLIEAGEGHGFYDQETQIQFVKHSIDFVLKHTGAPGER